MKTWDERRNGDFFCKNMNQQFFGSCEESTAGKALPLAHTKPMRSA